MCRAACSTNLLPIAHTSHRAYTSTPHIYTLSLHDALPISDSPCMRGALRRIRRDSRCRQSLLDHQRESDQAQRLARHQRSEEHTSELQSHSDIVCRLLLEKKKSDIKMRLHVLRGAALCSMV